MGMGRKHLVLHFRQSAVVNFVEAHDYVTISATDYTLLKEFEPLVYLPYSAAQTPGATMQTAGEIAEDVINSQQTI
mgnify:CR=1 FL=1